MSSEILIHVRPNETRVAFIQNGTLTDLMIERNQSRGLVGSIFRGKVARVLPGMQAAFVDVGLDRAAFLYVGDVRSDISGDKTDYLWDEEDTPEKSGEILFDEGGASSQEPPPEENRPPIQDLLSENQDILVQVAKDPLGTKGARITTHLSLPGRHVVYMPTLNHLGVSRKILDENERERLKQIVEKNKPEQGGFIVRTAAEGATEESIENDIKYLVALYQEIQKTYQKKKGQGLLHSDLDVELRAVRDLLNDEVVRVVVDDLEVYKKVSKFISQFMPRLKNKVEYYTAPQPLFDKYEIDLEVSRSLGRKVWLKSGGYIILDEAEALVVVDVNTGKFVGKKDLEDTILKTNLEAVKEIAHQLRIRNCGGIIIIDFIDMEKEINREKVLEALQEELKKDRAKTSITGMSSLGLVEMTRKRVRPSLLKTLCEPCSYCDGKGYIKNKNTVSAEIFRQIERDYYTLKSTSDMIIVHCHPSVADWIYDEESISLEGLEKKISKRIMFKVQQEFHIEQFEVEM
jgi:ribonuclease G